MGASHNNQGPMPPVRRKAKRLQRILIRDGVFTANALDSATEIMEP